MHRIQAAGLVCFLAAAIPATCQTPPASSATPTAIAVPRPPRPVPPPRDPHTAGYVTATELPDGANAPANADGNFILGPTHTAAPESSAQPTVPQGEVIELTMSSA